MVAQCEDRLNEAFARVIGESLQNPRDQQRAGPQTAVATNRSGIHPRRRPGWREITSEERFEKNACIQEVRNLYSLPPLRRVAACSSGLSTVPGRVVLTR